MKYLRCAHSVCNFFPYIAFFRDYPATTVFKCTKQRFVVSIHKFHQSYFNLCIPRFTSWFAFSSILLPWAWSLSWVFPCSWTWHPSKQRGKDKTDATHLLPKILLGCITSRRQRKQRRQHAFLVMYTRWRHQTTALDHRWLLGSRADFSHFTRSILIKMVGCVSFYHVFFTDMS